MANNPEQTGQSQPEEIETAADESEIEQLPAPVDTVARALDEEAKREEEFRPTGAFRFVLVLLAGYIIYFILTWHEIVILRGGA